ncbi:hypothetical protein [Sulfurimonas sp.]
MIKLTLFIFLILFTSGCINKHGISAKIYSDCNEYYDFQGYYHKDCGDGDIITYKTMVKAIKKKETKPKSNVW